MSQNYLILIIFIEIAVACLIIISIKIANEWVLKTQEIIDDLSVKAPEEIKDFRNQIKQFNIQLKNNLIPQPLNVQEFSSFIGEICVDLIKSRLPIGGISKKFIMFSIFHKLWKYRHRLKATFANQA